jgi:hypothetical protein
MNKKGYYKNAQPIVHWVAERKRQMSMGGRTEDRELDETGGCKAGAEQMVDG